MSFPKISCGVTESQVIGNVEVAEGDRQPLGLTARKKVPSARKRALCVHKKAAGAEMQVGTYCGAASSDSVRLVVDRGAFSGHFRFLLP